MTPDIETLIERLEDSHDTLIDAGCAYEAKPVADAITALRAFQWRPISEAPQDPEKWIWVYCPEYVGLPELICPCKWHPDAGFCVDELRTPTHFVDMGLFPLPASRASKEG